MGELYGEVNRSTLEWKDGLIGMSVRHAVQVSKLVHFANVLAFCNSQSYLLSRYCFRSDWRVSSVAKAIAIDAVGLRFDSRTGQIGQYSQRLAAVAAFLCCSCAKPRRWALPLVTRFGVIPRL